MTVRYNIGHWDEIQCIGAYKESGGKRKAAGVYYDSFGFPMEGEIAINVDDRLLHLERSGAGVSLSEDYSLEGHLKVKTEPKLSRITLNDEKVLVIREAEDYNRFVELLKYIILLGRKDFESSDASASSGASGNSGLGQGPAASPEKEEEIFGGPGSMEGLSAGGKSSTDSEEKDEEAEQKRQAEADERRANFRIEDSASYKKLEELVGLESVKKDVLELSSLMKMQVRRKRENLPEVPVSLHLVFAGNPGTGKTTIARILAEIYRDIGVLSKGQLVEVDRSGLVAGYVGQTAIKTREKIEEAKGGILFIDEAYTLSRGENDFGQEAIDTVLKAMEDMRDDFIVIVAGYTELMEGFIDSNPGLESRFNKYIFFPDYTADELIRIFSSMCKKYGYELTEDAKPILEEKIRLMEENKGENFANARDVRNLFEKIVTNQAKRLASLPEGDIRIITASDITGEEEKPKGDPEGENPEGKSPEGKSPEGESPEGGEKTGEDGETTMLREENASAQPTGSSENS